MTTPTRRRSATVSVSLTAALALTLTGCSSTPDRQYTQTCVKYPPGTTFSNGTPMLNGRPVTSPIRVDDDDCHRGGGSHGWYYFGSGSRYPAVGHPVSGGTTALPAGAHAIAGSTTGGTVAKAKSIQRGGFGKSSSGRSVGG